LGYFSFVVGFCHSLLAHTRKEAAAAATPPLHTHTRTHAHAQLYQYKSHPVAAAAAAAVFSADLVFSILQQQQQQ
jgi:hypothetical protein